MSLNILKHEIEKFLDSERPEVMAIKGAWGVGKTYTWNKLIKDARDQNKIKLNHYAYVSLFGINSLESFKYTIFEQTINIDLIGESPNLDTFKSNFNNLFSSFGRKSFKFLQWIPAIGDFLPAIQSASFLSVNKTIICIDDFERKSDAINLRDVLGLVLHLKDQKKCKIVLIFNNEKMGEENSDEYQKFREKVIDFEIEFKPTPKDCTEVSLSNQSEFLQELEPLIEKLGINNIRIIKKIERLANILKPILDEYDEEVFKKALHTLCLYCFCYYSNEKWLPPYEYIKRIIQPVYLGDIYNNKREKENDEEEKYNHFLMYYGYTNTDSFDLRIAEAVEKGYVNEDLLRDEAQKIHEQCIRSKADSSIEDAWSLYSDSFSNNQKEVIDCLYKSYNKNIKHITPKMLDNVVIFFRKFNEDSLADKLIEAYINFHRDNREFFSLKDDDIWPLKIKDTTIRNRFSEITAAQRKERTAQDVLAKIAGKDIFGSEDLKILANADSDEFYRIFKNESGDRLHSYINTCLKFGQVINANEEYKKITSNVILALKKIGKESLINKKRVESLGIQIDENKAD